MRLHLRTLCLSVVAVLGATALTLPTAASLASAPMAGPPAPPPLLSDKGHTLSDVSMLAADDAWAVGSRTEGSETLTWVQHWNGTSWKQVPSPSPGNEKNLLRSVATISPTDVWAVGGLENVGDSDERPLVEHWDGTSWNVVDQPDQSGRAYGVSASGPDDVWVAGGLISEHWDGTTWTDTTLEVPPVTPPYHVTLMEPYDVVALSAHNAWLIGIYDAQNDTGGYERKILGEHWDGTAWHFVSVPQEPTTWTYPFEIKATSAHDVWAVGATEFREHAFIAHYDGHRWSSTTQNLYGTQSVLLEGVTAIAPDDAWAVGYHGNNKHGINKYHPFAEHWDGSQWTVDDSVSPHADTAYLLAVGAAATNDAFAVGYLVNNGKTSALVDRWDGTTWQHMR